MEVMSKGEELMVEDVILANVRIVMARIIQYTFVGIFMGNTAHQVSLPEEENASQSLKPNSTTRVVSIPEEEYHRLVSLQSQSTPSASSTVTLAQSCIPFLNHFIWK